MNWHQRLRFVARLSVWCLAGAWSIYMASVAIAMSILDQSENPIADVIVLWIFGLPTMAVISIGYAATVSVLVDVVERSWARNVLALLVACVVLGQTEQQVLDLVGKPLEIHPPYPGFLETGWQYSRSRGGRSHHLRSIYFRDGLVWKVIYEHSVD